MDGLIQDVLLIRGGRRGYPLLIILLDTRHPLDGGCRRVELLIRDSRRLVGETGRRRLHLSVRRGNEQKPRGNYKAWQRPAASKLALLASFAGLLCTLPARE